jgi:capsular polysaccharide biosynthesis protein
VKKHKVILAGILVVLLFAIAGTVFFVMRNHNQNKKEQNVEKQKEENYLSLSASDREMADLYAELYEMSREDVAEQQVKTKDWEKTAKELEKDFFTISENEKYQMEKDGYSLEDLQEAERLSVKTGRKAIELAKAKGKVSDKRKWSEVVKDSEILTTEEQLGLTKEQKQKLEDKSLNQEERVEVAILLMNETYTFDEVIRELNAGKTVEELKK